MAKPYFCTPLEFYLPLRRRVIAAILTLSAFILLSSSLFYLFYLRPLYDPANRPAAHPLYHRGQLVARLITSERCQVISIPTWDHRNHTYIYEIRLINPNYLYPFTLTVSEFELSAYTSPAVIPPMSTK